MAQKRSPAVTMPTGSATKPTPTTGSASAAIEEDEVGGVGLTPFVADLLVDGAEAKAHRQPLAETRDGG